MIVRDWRPYSATLRVNASGKALVAYYKDGAWRRTAAWGAINALAPSRTRPQVRFQLRYNYPRSLAAVFRNACGPYRGPWIPNLVKGCTMPSGAHWAIQSWRRLSPNGGWRPFGARELHLSHWSGELPRLWLKWDWNYAGAPLGPYDHLYGRFTYRGVGVYGFGSTSVGNPTDAYGRNVYVDTHDSPWGDGWKRVNGFLAHRPAGNFCDAAYPNRFGRVKAGRGDRYRATAMGPGVTPIVRWEGPPPGPYRPGPPEHPFAFTLAADHRLPYDAQLDEQLDDEQRRIAPPGDSCNATH
jgi:hypothetical protein